MGDMADLVSDGFFDEESCDECGAVWPFERHPNSCPTNYGHLKRVFKSVVKSVLKSRKDKKMSKGKVDIAAQKCVTPEFRVSFPYVFKPTSFKNQEPKFSVTMLFDKDTDLTGVKKIVRAAAAAEFGADPKKWPKFKHPVFRDGDSEKPDVAGYENTIFAVAKNKTQPGLVDPRRQPILNERDFYAGCYARAEIIAYAYDNEFGKGIGLSLQNIQKLRDGEKLGGRKNAEDVFDEVADLGDDESSYAGEEQEEASGLGF